MLGLVVRLPPSVPLNPLINYLPLPLTEWQDERPPSPSYLRVLYLGKILQDEDTLASKLYLPYPTPLFLLYRGNSRHPPPPFFPSCVS